MAATHDFPSDLLAGQEELHQVRAELLTLLRRLPWSVEPFDGFNDDHGWRKIERPASPGWTPDEQAHVEKLRERERELAIFVTCHRYWSQLPTNRSMSGAPRPMGGAPRTNSAVRDSAIAAPSSHEGATHPFHEGAPHLAP